MYKISFYVPESHLEVVKEAMFHAGAGHMGMYEHCAWQTKGEGQFLPLAGSSPYWGEQGQLTRLTEYKVEMICPAIRLAATLSALKSAHPYEMPAYDVVKLESW